MTPVVMPVDCRRNLRRFMDLPAALYRGQAGHEPPLRMDRAMLLDPRKGAFFGRGAVRYWLAMRDGEYVGRISAQIGRDQPVGVPSRTGMFGCLDAIDDRRVIAALLGTAEAWLAEQGCDHAFGPFALSMNGEPGMLIDGFEVPPMTGTPWHPPWLSKHVQALGYEKWKDLHGWRLALRDLDGDGVRREMRLGQRRSDVTARPISGRTLRADLPLMRDLYNDGWCDNWGHVPMTLADLQGLLTLAPIMPPWSGRVFMIAGRPVAFMLAIPNVYELTAGLGPAPSPPGWLRLGWRMLRYRPRSARIAMLGIAAHLRHSAAGAAIMLSMIDEMLAQQRRAALDVIEGGWVLEDKVALTRFLERYNFGRARTFRVFGRSFSDGAMQGSHINE